MNLDAVTVLRTPDGKPCNKLANRNPGGSVTLSKAPQGGTEDDQQWFERYHGRKPLSATPSPVYGSLVQRSLPVGPTQPRRGNSMRTRTLPDVARALEREHQAAQEAARLAAEHAVACGRILPEAKAGMSHDEWVPWLRARGISARRVQKYMRRQQWRKRA